MAQYTNRMVKKMRTDEVICELIEGGADMVTNHGVTVTYFPLNTQYPAHMRSYEAVIAKQNDECGCIDVLGKTAAYGDFVSMTTSIHVGKLLGELRHFGVPYRIISSTDGSVLESYVDGGDDPVPMSSCGVACGSASAEDITPFELSV